MEAPIAAPIPAQRSIWAIVLPVTLIVGMVSFIVVMFASGMRTIGYGGGMFGGMMMFGMVGMLMRGRGVGQRMSWSEYMQVVRRWFSTQDGSRERVDELRKSQWDRRTHLHPDPVQLMSVVGTSRMWERSDTPQPHPEFAVVRVGTGKVALAMNFDVQKTTDPAEMEPATGHALRRFLIEQAYIDGMPKTIWLQRFPGLAVVGDLARARALARSMLCQLAAFHSPADVQFFVVTEEPREWEWVKWLPHAQHESVRDGCGERRLIFSSPGELEGFLDETEEVARGRWNPPASALPGGTVSARPLRIIIDDACGQASAWSGLTGAAGYDGTCFLRLAAEVPPPPAGLGGTVVGWVGFDPATTYRLRGGGKLRKKVPEGSLAAAGGATGGGDELDEAFYATADQVSVVEAEVFARALARHRAPDSHSMVRAAEQLRPTLLQTLGITDPRLVDWPRAWAKRRTPGPAWMHFPIGTDDSGEIVYQNLKEGSQGGMGMHSLFIGTTGAGKSEGIITEVCSLCATHSPESANVVFMDFKMKSAAGVLEKFPHTLAAVSNLRSEKHLLGRFYDALHGELDRRGEVLAAYDGCQDLTDYNKLRLTDPSLPPVPALYVIIDEYNEALDDPDYGQRFRELFVRIGRQGRSMHMFLQLVGQTFDPSKLRDIETLLGFRIVGRTATGEQSTAAMKSNLASLIDPIGAEGTAYLKIGQRDPNRFRFFYCSGGFVPPAEGVAAVAAIQAGTWFEPRAFTAEVAEDVDGLLTTAVEVDAEPEPQAPAEPIGKLHQVLADAWTQTGETPPRQLWLPPLPRQLDDGSWDQVLPTVDEMVARYRGKPWDVDYGDNPGLRFPVALEDDPRQSAQRPHCVDLLNDNLMVVGAPQRGATTALMTLVVSGALMYRPERVQFYCIAASGPQLQALSSIPHVAAVVPLLDTEGVARLLAAVRAIATERERVFAARNLDIEMVREAKFGPAPTDIGIDGGDIVVVIDGWANFSTECQDQVATVEALVRARNYGVRVVLSAVAHMATGLTSAIRNETTQRLELSIADPLNSYAERVGPEKRMPAKDVPPMPGRGITKAGNQFMVASPALHRGEGTVVGVRDIGAVIAQRSGVAQRAALARLPESVSFADVLAKVGPEVPRDWLPIGVSESDLSPAYLRLSQHPHALAIGLAGSGRTNFVRTVCRSIMARYSSKEAAILLCDPGRHNVGVVDKEYLDFYGFLPAQIKEMIDGPLTDLFQRRLPPADADQEELLTRKFWEGREYFLIIDDMTVWSAMDTPYQGLADYVGQAASLGFHIIATADVQTWMGSSYGTGTPGRMTQALTPTLLLNGDRSLGVVVHGQRGQTQRPGKGVLASARGAEGMLVAWTDPRTPGDRK